MTTDQVVARFIARKAGTNSRISTDGENVWSYSTLIAYRDDDGSIWVNQGTYSNTTKTHLHAIYSATTYNLRAGKVMDIPVDVRVDNRGWTHADERPATYMFGRSPRKGSVGYRPVDDVDGGHVATFAQVDI